MPKRFYYAIGCQVIGWGGGFLLFFYHHNICAIVIMVLAGLELLRICYDEFKAWRPSQATFKKIETVGRIGAILSALVVAMSTEFPGIGWFLSACCVLAFFLAIMYCGRDGLKTQKSE
jgi:hypothetical protein